ncbi:MAG TPA: hypothetical protein VNX47_08510 [Nevskia sp.]|jgi:hypothetical protein|nr:hypothetical protein [Nevskia sp.]
MAWLRFFDSGRAVAFARTVIDEYCKVHALSDHNRKHAGRKSDRNIALVRRASAFARSEKLNFYVRAKMLAEIKNGLKDAGIATAEADEFVRTVALETLRRPGPA